MKHDSTCAEDMGSQFSRTDTTKTVTYTQFEETMKLPEAVCGLSPQNLAPTAGAQNKVENNSLLLPHQILP